MKRTIETQARYDQAKKTGESIVEVGQDGETFFNLSRTHALEQYNYWVIIPNDFPYDSIFSKHDLLVPKRSFNFIREATPQEREEYYEIKKGIDGSETYESIIENFSSTRSAKGHFHAHLVVWKA